MTGVRCIQIVQTDPSAGKREWPNAAVKLCPCARVSILDGRAPISAQNFKVKHKEQTLLEKLKRSKKYESGNKSKVKASSTFRTQSSLRYGYLVDLTPCFKLDQESCMLS